MTIKEEMAAAEREANDLLWRQHLIARWRITPDATMEQCAHSFAERHGFLFDIPSWPDGAEHAMRIQRYLAVLYPMVSDVLYDGCRDGVAVALLGRAVKGVERTRQADAVRNGASASQSNFASGSMRGKK